MSPARVVRSQLDATEVRAMLGPRSRMPFGHPFLDWRSWDGLFPHLVAMHRLGPELLGNPGTPTVALYVRHCRDHGLNPEPVVMRDIAAGPPFQVYVWPEP